jgi:replication factor C subunit 2/4
MHKLLYVESLYVNEPMRWVRLEALNASHIDARVLPFTTLSQEAYSRITRFILICNYVTRIIEPLASRCAKFRFQALPAASMKERLTVIATSEGCSPGEMELLDDILAQADGDMRRAVTTLQSVHSLVVGARQKNNNVKKTIDSSVIAEIAGLPPPKVVDDLWLCMTQGSFDIMHRGVDEVIASGFSAQLLLSGLLNKLLSPECMLDELSQAEVAIRIAEAEKNMIDGADEYLQLMTVSSLIQTCYQKSLVSSK